MAVAAFGTYDRLGQPCHVADANGTLSAVPGVIFTIKNVLCSDSKTMLSPVVHQNIFSFNL
jgi:hypothetical protein